MREVSQQRDQACVYLILHRACKDAVLQKLKEIGFAQVMLRDVSETAADQRLQTLDDEQAEVERQREETNEQIAALGGRHWKRFAGSTTCWPPGATRLLRGQTPDRIGTHLLSAGLGARTDDGKKWKKR